MYFFFLVFLNIIMINDKWNKSILNQLYITCYYCHCECLLKSPLLTPCVKFIIRCNYFATFPWSDHKQLYNFPSFSASTTDLSSGFDSGTYLRKSPDQYSSRGSMESLDPPVSSQYHSGAQHHHPLGHHSHSGSHPTYSSCHQLSSARFIQR